MTHKTTMPEPVASRWRWRDIENDPWKTTQGAAWKNPTAAPKLEVEQLITTNQAEAYANDRVKQALEEAAMILKANAEVCHSDTGIILRANAEAIRALIPKGDV